MALTKIKLAQMDANSVDSDQYVDGSIDNAHLADGAVDSAKLGNNISLGGTLTVGVDDTGHDVKFFGASTGRYWQWDESADKMVVNGAIDAHNQYNIKPGGEFFNFENTSAWHLTFDKTAGYSGAPWTYAIDATKTYVKLYGGEESGNDNNASVKLQTKTTGVDISGDLDVSSEITTIHIDASGWIRGNYETANESGALNISRFDGNGNPDTVDGRTYTSVYSAIRTRPTVDLVIELDDATIFEIKWDTAGYPNDAGGRLASFKPEAGVKLFYNDANKLETTTTGVTVTGTVTDSKGDVRKIIQNTQGSAYTLVADDAGKHILASGTVTVPNSVFAAGDAVTIVNNTAGDLTITKTITTMYNAADGSSDNRTLATRGVATILFASGTVAYITGAGLS